MACSARWRMVVRPGQPCRSASALRISSKKSGACWSDAQRHSSSFLTSGSLAGSRNWASLGPFVMFHGSIPALITRFRNGILDERGFQDFVEWQIGEGSHGLVPCGTTGESATLSLQEHLRVVRLCVEAAQARAPVIAGAGSNSTAHAIELAKGAKAAGADAVLVVAPYYNKPSQ